MPSEIDLIKEKIDLVEFLRTYLELTPTGKNFKALCPFHQEKTPSFFVSPDKKIWHCFGCGLGGDVIRFVMLYEHLEFPEALRFLGEKSGVEISRLSQREQKEFDVLYSIHKTAVDFYKEKLKESKDALSYLKKRGLEEETIEEFDLGFAPYGEELTKHLLKNKFSLDYILKAGLAQKSTSGLYKDRFQNRVIFPITNQIGKVVAFTGRILPLKNGKDPEDSPKYLNSPETLIFNKSKILYGLGKTKQFINEKKEVVIVEGQMDLLMMWQAGIKNIVAVSGTGLTEEHLLRLRKIADKVIIIFDKDKAGIKALERSLPYFYKFDFFIKVLDLGKYKDPAAACLAGKDIILQKLNEAKPALEYLMGIYIKEDFKNKEIFLRKKIVQHLLKLIANLKSSVEKSVWLENLSARAGISQDDLREELYGLSNNFWGTEEEIITEKTTKTENLYFEMVKKLYILSLTDESFLSIIKNEISSFSFEIFNFIKNELEPQKNVLELEADYIKNSFDKKLIVKEFNDLLRKLKIKTIQDKISKLKENIKEAEKKGNENLLKSLLSDFNEEVRKLNKLKSGD